MKRIRISREARARADRPYRMRIKRTESGYFVRHPELPGCSSSGRTLDEVHENAKDARALYIEMLMQDGLPVPEPKRKVRTPRPSGGADRDAPARRS